MSHQKRTILIVEDEESITTPLAEALERDGFNAEIAHTVADALGRGRTLRPDLVLLDIGLPDGSGLDVCRELRSSSNVPIIILSRARGGGGPGRRARARRRRLRRQAVQRA